ncbi:MAG: hypothetical protein WAL91_11105 [Propionicimonas sp.]
MSKAMVKVAAMVAATVALVGCAGGNPLTAAYVGADPIPQSEVDDVSQAIADASEDTTDTAGTFSQTVVQILIQSDLAAQAAASQGITVTDAQRQQVYDSNPLYGTLLNNPASSAFMTAYANTAVILADTAGQTAFASLVSTTPITLNPRLGVWDAAKGGIVEGSTGSISDLASAVG